MLLASLTTTPSEPLFGAAIFATVGGFLVFTGLCLEKWGTPKPKHDAKQLKYRKIADAVGWCVLMFGIAVEIYTAGKLAMSEKAEMNQLRSVAERNDLQKQPIQTITAEAWLFVKGTNLDIPLEQGPLPWSSYITSRLDTVSITGLTETSAQGSREPAFGLVASKVEVQKLFTNGILVKFEFEKPPFLGTVFKGHSGDLYTWDVLVLTVPFLEGGRELLTPEKSGEITIKVNSMLSRTYEVPHQKTHFASRDISIIATNGQFRPYDFWRMPDPRTNAAPSMQATKSPAA
ncbi:MAG: hypothetical protein JWQ71_834 [Pedosphaera sp.]|nr:hypothetical protein [Pedosphaera sp.]